MAPITDPSQASSTSEQSAVATSTAPLGSQPGSDYHTGINSVGQQCEAGEDYSTYPAADDMASGDVWTFPGDGEFDTEEPESCTLPGISLPFPLSYNNKDIRSRPLESDWTGTEELSVAKKFRLSASSEKTRTPLQVFGFDHAASMGSDSPTPEHEMMLQEFMADPDIDPEDSPSLMFESPDYVPPTPMCEDNHEGCIRIADMDRSLMVRESEETVRVYNAIMNKKKRQLAERAARNPPDHRHRDPDYLLQAASNILNSYTLTEDGQVHPRHDHNYDKYDNYDHDYHKIQ